jgi:Fur family transcriptional regulator, ferric uptake regulator
MKNTNAWSAFNMNIDWDSPTEFSDGYEQQMVATTQTCGTSSAKRVTVPKTLVQQVLEEAHAPLLPREVLARVNRTHPQIGISTIYRNLKEMVSTGHTQIVVLADQHPRYEHLGNCMFHDHFQCTGCQTVSVLHAAMPGIEYGAPLGFSVKRHALALYGECATCVRHEPLRTPWAIEAPLRELEVA